MNRLTDAELEAMAGHTDGPWDVDNYGDIHVNGLDIAMPMIGFGDEMDAANSALLVAAPAMYAELLERRAMDAVVRDSLAWALGLIDAPTGHSRLVSQRYAERWDAAHAALAKLQETSNG